ncbi:MAG: DUF6544 family protein [Eubacteriales bacterium]
MFNTKWIILILIILMILLLFYLSSDLQRQYKAEVQEGLAETKKLENTILTEKDIAYLPEPVQKYLKYVGVLEKERVSSLHVTINGAMKTDKDKDWANVDVQQYSFFNQPTRLFFLKMNMSGIPIIGLHAYKNAKATMDIKVAGIFPVVDGKGKEMNQGETVTVFNDMCILAPASLIDERIQWETIDTQTVRATFTNEDIKINAILYFNEEGQLINFVSDDRYYSPTGKTYQSVRWSTPISDYKNIDGFNLATYGEAIWNFSEGDYCYAKFNIKAVAYNVDQ